jgi:pyruvate dehydrogenase E2 component (dihydrolipoamide acetyltransferase)
MAVAVIMPKTGMSQETGTIVKWLLKEGDQVEKGQPLLEVMNDKVNMEVEAPASGVLQGIRAFPNDVIPVTQVIAYIAQPGEELPADQVVSPPAVERTPQRTTPAAEPAVSTPAAVPSARDGVPAPSVRDGVPAGRSTRTGAAPSVPPRERLAATPTARRVAKEHGLDLAGIPGTGPGGVITKADVLQASESTMRTAAAAVSPEVHSIPLAGRRRIIAERMQQSMQQAPHIALTIEVDMSQAETARHGASYTALLVSVVACALRKHPVLNSTLRGDQIVLLDEVNIGVAIATDEGLIVPVVKNADRKALQLLDAEIKYLTERARSGKLTLDEVSGGTFTISNLGMFGIPQFRAIINPPEAAILAVGSIVKRPVVIDDGLHIRPIMALTASADHRILDGVVVAGFLHEIKTTLETGA